MNIAEKMEVLRNRLAEVCDVRSAVSLLHWDQETYMPPKGAEGRGRQLATLSAIEHRLFTASEVGALLEELAERMDRLEPDDAALADVALYDYRIATRLPEAFVQEFAEEQSRAHGAWVQARRESRFDLFEPNLEKLVALLRRKADYLGYQDSPYDALLELFERGMTTARLRTLFGELAARQSALIERIMNAPRHPDLSWLDGEWDEQTQWELSLDVLRDMGYDFEAGRQDRSVHPFSTIFDVHDVRVTTRTDPRLLFACLTGSIHEGGHALYMQGHQERDRRTPLCDAPSLGMHESQSRMWENMIGRSLPFWKHYAPAMRARFPGRLDGVAPEDFHAAINRVTPSLIRVEADECTYNLHIILRFEIETALIEGALRVADVPEAWNAKMKEYLGLDVPDDANGCLQDIHWAHGAMGYFPTYALGNLYAAQIFEAILRELPDLWAQVEEARFAPLREWLRERIHRLGRRRNAPDLVRDLTGREPEPGAYLGYLENKYGALYGL